MKKWKVYLISLDNNDYVYIGITQEYFVEYRLVNHIMGDYESALKRKMQELGIFNLEDFYKREGCYIEEIKRDLSEEEARDLEKELIGLANKEYDLIKCLNVQHNKHLKPTFKKCFTNY